MKVTRENNTFIRQNTHCGDRSIKTKYQFKDLDGTMYNIYISVRKNAFIKKVNKFGKEKKLNFQKKLQLLFLKNLNLIKIKFLRKKVELDNYSTPVERIVA